MFAGDETRQDGRAAVKGSRRWWTPSAWLLSPTGMTTEMAQGKSKDLRLMGRQNALTRREVFSILREI